jgi:hypothetical protein
VKVRRRIQVRSGPVTLDADPQLKVAKTELILECDDARQVLDTAESGGGRSIFWTVKSCFDTRLRVYLADTSGQLLGALERRYEGLDQFLEHFSGPPRVFRLSDLIVENATQLAPYGLRTVSLRYSFAPEDRQQVLKDIEAYRRHEGNIQTRLDLPSKIMVLPQ